MTVQYDLSEMVQYYIALEGNPGELLLHLLTLDPSAPSPDLDTLLK
jgi:hypothetical protein